MLVGLSVISYIERVNLSVAGEMIMREFGFTATRMGFVFGSFMVGYTLFQLPAGRFADLYGPRRVLGWAAFAWAACTAMSGLFPGVVLRSGSAVLGGLIVIRFALGIFEAPTYPAAGRALAIWVPESERAFASALVLTGAALGSALTPPALSQLVIGVGWRWALLIVSLPAALAGGLWLKWFTDWPEAHPRINVAELKHIARRKIALPVHPVGWSCVLKSRNLWWLSLSYLLHSYVTYIFIFWFFIYLVDVRGFTMARGGIFASLPFLLATVLSPLGGAISDRASSRWGRLWGRRAVPCLVLPVAAVLVFFGGGVPNPYVAVVLFSLAAGLAWAAEGPFWASMTDIAGPYAGSAGGFLNMVGNIGGALSAMLTPIIAEHTGWVNMFYIASGMGLLAAVTWLLVESEPSVFHGAPAPSLGIDH